jgi:hypothetical protein
VGIEDTDSKEDTLVAVAVEGHEHSGCMHCLVWHMAAAEAVEPQHVSVIVQLEVQLVESWQEP